MKKKLTLTIDSEVTERAKRLAKRENTSVSEIVESYLAERTEEETEWAPDPVSNTAALLGSVTLPEVVRDLDYKKLKERAIRNKYGEQNTR
jgi:predicted CopG family antitoxin